MSGARVTTDLPLATTQVEALEAELGVHAVVECLDELPNPRLLACALDLCVGRLVGQAEGQVEANLRSQKRTGRQSQFESREGKKEGERTVPP